MRPARPLYAAMVLGALLLTGCGRTGDTPATTSHSTPGSAPVTVQAANGPVTIPAKPGRIVALSPTATEILFAVGAGSQVVAVDDQSDHPAQAPRTKLSGFKPSAEAVIGYRPDLVVLSNDTDGIVAALGKVKIPVLLEPSAVKLDDTYDQITDLGAATGHVAEAATLSAGMRRQIDQTVRATRAAAPAGGSLTYYHELTNDLFTATSKTFIGQVYGLFGLRNVADAADKAGTGYPKLSREALITSDPSLIFLADTVCCGQTPKTVAGRPGWQSLSAVKRGRVVALDDDIASRWGPRLVDLVKAIGAAVQQAA
ncbi:ABC transporter substrate-binding protein [Actinomadura scrupuli]|uniref:ABC transporter substrate-binding protein n=1 Tax=Actinomadura scrupuli TaxID=559629 RepID=UPI003D9538B3